MPKSEKHLLEGPDFTAEVKPGGGEDDGEWLAKVRLVDDGQRGKNVVLSASTAELLQEELARFEEAFRQVKAKVAELASAPSDGGGAVLDDQSAWPQ